MQPELSIEVYRLRSRSVYTSDSFNLPNAKMAETPVHHTITNRDSYVPKFSGCVGDRPCDLESFLRPLETHIQARGYTGLQAVQEAKSFIDTSVGDISSFIIEETYDNLATFDEFKSFLRSLYVSLPKDDILFSMARIKKEIRKDMEAYPANLNEFSARVIKRIGPWKQLLKESPKGPGQWVEEGDVMKVDSVAKLMTYSEVMSHIPMRLLGSLEHKWKPKITYADLHKEIKRKLPTIPEVEDWYCKSSPAKTEVASPVHTRQPRPILKSESGHSQVTRKNSPSPSVSFKGSSTLPNRSRQLPIQGSSTQPKSFGKNPICFKCQLHGHFASNCPTRYCQNHGYCAHSTEECSLNHYSQQRSSQSYFRGRGRSNNRFSSRNKASTRNRGNYTQNRSANSRQMYYTEEIESDFTEVPTDSYPD